MLHSFEQREEVRINGGARAYVGLWRKAYPNNKVLFNPAPKDYLQLETLASNMPGKILSPLLTMPSLFQNGPGPPLQVHQAPFKKA